MKCSFLAATLLLLPAFVLAHPGHGKPGFLHSHNAGELADWLANGALIFFGLVVFGFACWGAAQAWARLRRQERDRSAR